MARTSWRLQLIATTPATVPATVVTCSRTRNSTMIKVTAVIASITPESRASQAVKPKPSSTICSTRLNRNSPGICHNDIVHTDSSFGFATALEIATEAVDRLHSTAHSHHCIILTEIMGHRAGWLALGAGIAGGADVILLPEIPYSVDAIADKIERCCSHGSSFSVVAVAEGVLSVTDHAELEHARALVITK